MQNDNDSGPSQSRLHLIQSEILPIIPPDSNGLRLNLGIKLRELALMTERLNLDTQLWKLAHNLADAEKLHEHSAECFNAAEDSARERQARRSAGRIRSALRYNELEEYKHPELGSLTEFPEETKAVDDELKIVVSRLIKQAPTEAKPEEAETARVTPTRQKAGRGRGVIYIAEALGVIGASMFAGSYLIDPLFQKPEQQQSNIYAPYDQQARADPAASISRDAAIAMPTQMPKLVGFRDSEDGATRTFAWDDNLALTIRAVIRDGKCEAVRYPLKLEGRLDKAALDAASQAVCRASASTRTKTKTPHG